MFKHCSSKILFSILILFICTNLVNAQNNEQQAQQTGFNIDLSNVFGGFYYTDPLGVQLASRLKPFEGTIDLENYVLGANDLLSIKIDGSQSIFLRGILINPKGDISLPILGPVNINGLTVIEAQEKIKNASKDYIKNPEVTITLDSPRPIIFHVTGGAPYPGKYLALPQSRIDQAIFSSVTTGNRDLTSSISNSSEFLSNNSYSFRSIYISHADGSESTADLVKYFRTGDLKAILL